MEAIRNVEETPYLKVDMETGQVVGHEGRHRMALNRYFFLFLQVGEEGMGRLFSLRAIYRNGDL